MGPEEKRFVIEIQYVAPGTLIKRWLGLSVVNEQLYICIHYVEYQQQWELEAEPRRCTLTPGVGGQRGRIKTPSTDVEFCFFFLIWIKM